MHARKTFAKKGRVQAHDQMVWLKPGYEILNGTLPGMSPGIILSLHFTETHKGTHLMNVSTDGGTHALKATQSAVCLVTKNAAVITTGHLPEYLIEQCPLFA